MKPKQLLVVLVTAIILSAFALVLYQRQNNPGQQKEEGQLARGDLMLDDIGEWVEQIAQVKIILTDPPGEIALAKIGEQWQVQSCSGYPANPAKIQELVNELMMFTVADRLTAKPEKYENFGVVGDIGAQGVLSIEGRDGEQLLHLLFGKEREGGVSNPAGMPLASGRYVRRTKDPNVYLVGQVMNSLNPALINWVDTEIISLLSTELMTLDIEHVTTEPMRVDWRTGAPILADLADDQQLKPGVASILQSGYSRLRLTNVLAATDDLASSLSFVANCSVLVKDGTEYTVRAMENGMDKYITLSAAYRAPVFTDDDQATTAALEAAKAQATLASQKIGEINLRHAPWIYQVDEWSFDGLVKIRSEQIEPKPEEIIIPDELGLLTGTDSITTDTLNRTTNTLAATLDETAVTTGTLTSNFGDLKITTNTLNSAVKLIPRSNLPDGE